MKFSFCIRCSPEKMCDLCKVRLRLHEEVNNFPIDDLDAEIVKLASLSRLDSDQEIKLRYLHRRYRLIFGIDHNSKLSSEMARLLHSVARPAIG